LPHNRLQSRRCAAAPLTGDKIGRSVAFDVLRGTERLTVAAVPQERRRN
jgi:hypothetical protein